MSKEDLLKNADIVSIHVVLSEKYKNLITKRIRVNEKNFFFN